MIHTLAISLLLAPILVACSSPPKQDYRIGSKVYRSGTTAEAALTDVKPKEASEISSNKKIRLLRAPMPSMPIEAINADLSDTVTVNILFNEAGEVESVVQKTYRHSVLLEAVLAVVRQWKIEPSVEAGTPVKTAVQQSFQFEVQ